MTGAASGGNGPSLTFGVEEEFFLVDPESRDLLVDPDPGIFAACEETCGPHKVVRELLRTQVETNTRICDICTRLEDAVTIVALYASLIRRLLRQDQDGALPPEPPTEIIAENRWLAQRYGVVAFFGDTARGGGRVDIEDYAHELVEELAGDARALGCENEIRRALTIIREGAGADRQLDLFRLRRLEGDTEEEALRRVVDLVLAETREEIEEASRSP